MSIVNYPDSFPVEAAAFYVGLFRKTEGADKEKICFYGWNLAGYIAKSAVGEPVKEAINAGPLNIDSESVAVAIETLDPSKPQQILLGGLTRQLLFSVLLRVIEKAVGSADLPGSIDSIIDAILRGVSGAE